MLYVDDNFYTISDLRSLTKSFYNLIKILYFIVFETKYLF
jgi:hypothetical protein